MEDHAEFLNAFNGQAMQLYRDKAVGYASYRARHLDSYDEDANMFVVIEYRNLYFVFTAEDAIRALASPAYTGQEIIYWENIEGEASS